MLALALCLIALFAWPAAGLALEGQGGINSNAITTAYSQIGSGNGAYGNSSQYSAAQYVANEIFSNGGTIVHLTCNNITGGTCTTSAPIFNASVIHGGVETLGTQLSCSTTKDTVQNAPSQVENLTWVAGDTVALKLISIGTGCNGPAFDVDLLVKTP